MPKKLSDKIIISKKGILRENVGEHPPYIETKGTSLFNNTSELAEIALKLGYSFGNEIKYKIVIEKKK